MQNVNVFINKYSTEKKWIANAFSGIPPIYRLLFKFIFTNLQNINIQIFLST